MKNLVVGVSLLLGACGSGGKFSDIAGNLGFGGGEKDCVSTVAAEAAAPAEKAVSDEATKTPAVAVQPAQAVAKAPDVLPPPTSAEGRRLARMAAKAEAAAATEEPAVPPVVEPVKHELAANEATADEAPAPRPLSRHRRSVAVAEPGAVSRKAPVNRDDRYNNFSESTAPSEYRLPVSAQVLVPREGQTVLNGPRHEGVPPPNTDPVRISQN